MGTVTMSMKELNQISIFSSIIKGEILQKDAALLLNLTTRQVRRKCKRYIKDGVSGLTHKGRGNTSNRKIKPDVLMQALNYLRTTYQGYGPTLAAEKLAQNNGIQINHETLRRYMIEEGLWDRKQKKINPHVWREPKHHFGEMVQVDGSYHIWFGKEYSTLVAFIDDATNTVELRFSPHESTYALVDTTRSYLNKYGRPLKLYTDRGRTFKVNNSKTGEQVFTQYQRMLKEIDIDIIHARSPQAKGRVERLFRTLQDRLVKELRVQGIATMTEANLFLQKCYIAAHNKQFSHPPQANSNFHRTIEGYDLDTIFCIKETRILNNDYTICYKNRWFQLDCKQPVIIYKHSAIIVCRHRDGDISLMANGRKLNYKEIDKRPHNGPKKRERVINDRYVKPKTDHPWRRIYAQTIKRTFL